MRKTKKTQYKYHQVLYALWPICASEKELQNHCDPEFVLRKIRTQIMQSAEFGQPSRFFFQSQPGNNNEKYRNIVNLEPKSLLEGVGANADTEW